MWGVEENACLRIKRERLLDIFLHMFSTYPGKLFFLPLRSLRHAETARVHLYLTKTSRVQFSLRILSRHSSIPVNFYLRSFISFVAKCVFRSSALALRPVLANFLVFRPSKRAHNRTVFSTCKRFSGNKIRLSVELEEGSSPRSKMITAVGGLNAASARVWSHRRIYPPISFFSHFFFDPMPMQNYISTWNWS